MDNAGLPEQPIEFKKVSPPDIPEAQRDGVPQAIAPASRFNGKVWRFWLLGLLGMAIALFAGVLVQLSQTPVADSSPALPVAIAQSPSPLPQQATPLPQPTVPADTLLGHFPYKEAPPETLRPVSRDGQVKLRVAAAAKFQEMALAARRAGVFLVPISGFRSLDDQNYLFFEVKAQQGATPRERAEVSAPPGYSEHHTGYAIDIGDGGRPATNLQVAFETTPAFRWLTANAVRYSFELSFPRNNPQGVSYEPWHWRFVGDRDSLETFYRARPSSPSASPLSSTPLTSPTAP